MAMSSQNRKEYEALISAFFNPQNPVEWNIALNNWYSPIFQERERLFEEGMLTDALIMERLFIFVENLKKENLKELEKFLKDKISVSILTETKLKEAEKLTSQYTLEELAKKTLNDLRKMARELPILLSALNTEYKALKNEIENTQVVINNINAQSQQLDQSVLNAIRDNVINKNIVVLHADGSKMGRKEFEEWMSRPAMNPKIDESEPAKAVSLGDMIAQLYKNDPSLLANDMFDDQLAVRRKQFNDKFLKYSELAYDAETGFLNPTLMLSFFKANDLLEKIWLEANNDSSKELSGYVKELRACVPKHEQDKKRLDSTEREIKRLETLVNNVDELIKEHEKKISRRQEG